MKLKEELMVGPVCCFISFMCLVAIFLIFVSGTLGDQFNSVITVTIIMAVALFFGRKSIHAAFKWLATPIDKDRIIIIVDGEKTKREE